MGVSAAVAGGAIKGAGTWLNTLMSNWISKREKSALEDKLWAEITNTVLKHVKAMSVRFTKITTVAFPKTPVDLHSIYIPLTLASISSDAKFLIKNFPHDLFTKCSKVLLVDVAGMGKSTLSKIIFLKSLEEKVHLPILIDLRRLKSEEKIEVALGNQFGLKPKHEELFQEFLSTQPLLFIFDGFDEVPDGNKISVAREIRDFVDRSTAAKFLITSRPEVLFSDYTDFGSFHIEGLTKDQAQNLIIKYGDAYQIKDRAKALLEELRARHDTPVESFLKNPLLTSLLFRAFEFKSVVPVKRGVFYRQVFDALYESHDLSKETGYVRDKKTGLHHDDFHRAMRALASLFRQKRAVEVNTETFLKMAKDVSKSLCPDLPFQPEDLLYDVVHSVPLFTRDGIFIRWSHKSILDYFLSEFLLRDYSKAKDEALKKITFSEDSATNENFLVLVNEADPTLFANAVTLPASKLLLERYAKIKKELPKDLDNEVTEELATFFMSYEIVKAPIEVFSTENPWLKVATYKEIIAGDETTQFFLRHINFFGKEKGALLIFINPAAAALTAQIRLDGVKHLSFFDLTHKNLSRVEAISEFNKPKEATSFYHSYLSSGDWSGIEDEFSNLLILIGSLDIKIPSPKNLEKLIKDLEKPVNDSIKARSDDVF